MLDLGKDDRGLYLLAIRPTPNSRNYLGKDCTECHDAPENSPLGVISMKTSLNEIDLFLEHQRRETMVVSLLVSCFLFAFIWLVINTAKNALSVAEKSAGTDPLTGLANRRQFIARAGVEIERIRRNRQLSSTILMLDLDHFKLVNDEHGHATGDEVLRAVGDLLHSESRKTDLAGRLGGEEFAMLLSDTDEREAGVIAERLRQKTSSHVITRGEKSIRISVSIGVAGIQPGDAGPEDALARSDRALYQAKNAGRNRVVFAPAARQNA